MKYFLVFKTEPFTTNAFYTAFRKDQYQIIGEKETVFLVGQKEETITLSEEEINYILGMARVQKLKGIVDITREVEFLINFKGTHKEKMHQFAWRMRNCFTRAFIKNEE